MNRILTIFIFVFGFKLAILCGQNVQLVLPSMTASSGSNVEIPVKILSRDSLTSLQFTISWDSTRLQFDGITGEALPPFLTLSNPTSGRLTFLWYDGAARGIRLADSLAMFRIQFVVTGANGTTADLQFASVPTRILASNAAFQAVSVGTRNGQIRIERTNTVEPVGYWGGGIESVFPNPIQDFLTLKTNFKNSENIVIQCFTIDGKKIFEVEKNMESQNQQTTIDVSNLPENQYFLLTIKNKVGQLLFQQTLYKP